MEPGRTVREAAAARARRYPLVADTALALALLVAALVSSHVAIEVNQATSPTYRPPDTAGVVLALGLTFVPLTARRRLPLATLPACAAGFVATLPVNGEGS